MVKVLSTRAAALRSLIRSYVQERLALRIDKLEEDDPKRAAEIEKHQPDIWLEDASRRVLQIQVVTHPHKATYPNAKINEVTSLYRRPEELPKHSFVSSHSLPVDFHDDVSGNAAALSVYGLLQRVYEGQTLLQLALEKDPDLQDALSDDPVSAQRWLQAFAGLIKPRTAGAVSHSGAKQLYWLTGQDPLKDQDYSILAPLYSSSLAHHVYLTLQEDRFGEANKEARSAWVDGRYHERPYRTYPNWAVQKLGGSNPQNVSQLNVQRLGNNYLLASLPPQWKGQKLQPPLLINSIFDRFQRHAGTHFWVKSLRDFLESDPPSNVATRNRRDALLSGLLDELHIFAMGFQELPLGWSVEPDCTLAKAQQLWLDPLRGLIDDEFCLDWLELDWPEQVGRDFANWLNEQLGPRLPLGDVEHGFWSKELRGETRWMVRLNQHRRQLQSSKAGEV